MVEELLDLLSAPRKALMGLATGGKYDSLTGMAGDNPLLQALAMLGDVAIDPLTWTGAALAKPLGVALRGGQTARVAGMADDAVNAARKAVDASKASDLATQTASQMDRFNSMRGYISPESLATGASRTYARPDPGIASKLQSAGLGTYDEAANTFNLQAGLKKNMSHADKAGAPGVPPPFARPVPGRGNNLVEGPVKMPSSMATMDEIEMLRRQAQMHGPEALTSIHSSADIFPEVAMMRAQQMAQASPESLAALDSAQSILEQALLGMGEVDEARQLLGSAGRVGGLAGLAGVGYGAGNQIFGG